MTGQLEFGQPFDNSPTTKNDYFGPRQFKYPSTATTHKKERNKRRETSQSDEKYLPSLPSKVTLS
ncbi:DUF2977 domain-containing protein [Sesbania bispinosa]|nr:DUF2977 domain-containing protein [Sesbania bispinosa]